MDTQNRRETVSGYLKAAGIAVRSRGRPSEAKPKPAISEEVSTDLGAKPAITSPGVFTDPVRPPPPGRAPSASACEPYREIIVEALARGRNAVAIWQDLVDDHGFPARYASVSSPPVCDGPSGHETGYSVAGAGAEVGPSLVLRALVLA